MSLIFEVGYSNKMRRCGVIIGIAGSTTVYVQYGMYIPIGSRVLDNLPQFKRIEGLTGRVMNITNSYVQQ